MTNPGATANAGESTDAGITADPNGTTDADAGGVTEADVATAGVTRLVRRDDAAEVAELIVANRKFLAPWDPVRLEEFYTEAGQRQILGGILDQYALGTALPLVIIEPGTGRIVGRITLSAIAWGPFQSCNLGYWVSEDANGRGLATAAVREITTMAFEKLKLHRVEAGTLLHNAASQRVLTRNGFVRFGTAPRYLRIAGEWQDHAMFQLIRD